jgi:hypothetical protein
MSQDKTPIHQPIHSNIHRHYIIQTLLHHIPGLHLIEPKDLGYYYLLELKHITIPNTLKHKRKKKT